MDDKVRWTYLLMLTESDNHLPKITLNLCQEVFRWISSMENTDNKIPWFGVVNKLPMYKPKI